MKIILKIITQSLLALMIDDLVTLIILLLIVSKSSQIIASTYPLYKLISQMNMRSLEALSNTCSEL